MKNMKEIKFRDHCGDLVGCQNGMTYIIRTEPGAVSGTPSHWVVVASESGEVKFNTVCHQFFHLDEAKEFCQQVAAGNVDLAELQRRYDEEDEARLREVRREVAEKAKAFCARLSAVGLSYRDFLKLEVLHNVLGEMGHQVLLELERGEDCVSPTFDIRWVN